MDTTSALLRCGLVACVLWNSGIGHRPLLGAYFSPDFNNGEWIPTSWTEDGFKIDSETPTNLDIVEVIETETEATA